MAAVQALSAFAVAPNDVDYALVPTRTPATGAQIPAISLGTFGSDKHTGDQTSTIRQKKAPL